MSPHFQSCVLTIISLLSGLQRLQDIFFKVVQVLMQLLLCLIVYNYHIACLIYLRFISMDYKRQTSFHNVTSMISK